MVSAGEQEKLVKTTAFQINISAIDGPSVQKMREGAVRNRIVKGCFHMDKAAYTNPKLKTI